jgi:hypothetical protein
MADEQAVETTAPALGPGDDDPRSPSGSIATALPALGPGDDDPRSPIRGAIETTAGPAGPGDGPEDDYHTLFEPALGPGDDARSPRQVTRFPKRREV